MFVISKLFTDNFWGNLIVVPIVFVVLFFANKLLMRTVLTWLAKIKIVGYVIFGVYAVLALGLAIGMATLGDDDTAIKAYMWMAPVFGVAFSGANYFTYTPMFNKDYVEGEYQDHYSHSEGNTDYYVQMWHQWTRKGADYAVRMAMWIAIITTVASLILNVLIVLGILVALRVVRKLMKKDSHDLYMFS